MVTRTIDGGAQLRKALSDVATRLGREGTLSVGFMKNATYPDGTSVALVAMINEFGAPSRGQPPRPFFRNMIEAESDGWPGLIEGQLTASNMSTRVALDRVGATIVGQLKKSISDLMEPPLAESTIRRKGFSKPLIDTTQMLNSVTHEVDAK